MMIIPLFIGFEPSQVVQDLFIDSMTPNSFSLFVHNIILTFGDPKVVDLKTWDTRRRISDFPGILCWAPYLLKQRDISLYNI